MIAAVFSLLVAISGPQDSASKQLLVFEFPDGVRGGRGKIQGDSEPTYREPLGSVVPEDKIELLKRCGLKGARSVDILEHRIFVVGDSSKANVRILRCFKARTFSHFNVGVGQLTNNGWPIKFDQSSFQKFWNTEQRP